MTPLETFMPQDVVGKLLNEKVKALKPVLNRVTVSPVPIKEVRNLLPVHLPKKVMSQQGNNSDTLFWVLAIGGTLAVGTLWYMYESGHFRARRSIQRPKYD